VSWVDNVLGSGDVVYPLRVGNLYANQTINSSNGTTPVTIVTGSPGYYITDMGLQVDGIATLASAGMVNFIFADSSYGTIFFIRYWLPATGATLTAPTNNRQTTGPGNLIFNSKVADSTLQVSSSVALVTGSVRFFCRYGTTSYLG